MLFLFSVFFFFFFFIIRKNTYMSCDIVRTLIWCRVFVCLFFLFLFFCNIPILHLGIRGCHSAIFIFYFLLNECQPLNERIHFSRSNFFLFSFKVEPVLGRVSSSREGSNIWYKWALYKRNHGFLGLWSRLKLQHINSKSILMCTQHEPKFIHLVDARCQTLKLNA